MWCWLFTQWHWLSTQWLHMIQWIQTTVLVFSIFISNDHLSLHVNFLLALVAYDTFTGDANFFFPVPPQWPQGQTLMFCRRWLLVFSTRCGHCQKSTKHQPLAPGLLSQNWLLQYYSRESSSSFLPYSSLITKLPPNMTCILCHSKIMLLYHSRRPKDIFNLLMTCSFP